MNSTDCPTTISFVYLLWNDVGCGVGNVANSKRFLLHSKT